MDFMVYNSSVPIFTAISHLFAPQISNSYCVKWGGDGGYEILREWNYYYKICFKILCSLVVVCLFNQPQLAVEKRKKATMTINRHCIHIGERERNFQSIFQSLDLVMLQKKKTLAFDLLLILRVNSFMRTAMTAKLHSTVKVQPVDDYRYWFHRLRISISILYLWENLSRYKFLYYSWLHIITHYHIRFVSIHTQFQKNKWCVAHVNHKEIFFFLHFLMKC